MSYRFRILVRRYSISNPGEVVATKDFGINVGEHVDIPYLEWKLKLDVARDGKAHFCLCEHTPEEVEVEAKASGS